MENEVADNVYQRSELDYLIYIDLVAYADLILSSNPEAYLKAKEKPLLRGKQFDKMLTLCYNTYTPIGTEV